MILQHPYNNLLPIYKQCCDKIEEFDRITKDYIKSFSEQDLLNIYNENIDDIILELKYSKFNFTKDKMTNILFLSSYI